MTKNFKQMRNNVDVQLIYDLNKETDLKLKDFYRDVYGL